MVKKSENPRKSQEIFKIKFSFYFIFFFRQKNGIFLVFQY